MFRLFPPEAPRHKQNRSGFSLRQLMDMPAADPGLRHIAERALTRVNRDVVDAEQRLGLG